MPEIRGNPDSISAAWLTEVLQHAGVDAEVAGFRAGEVGTGQVGRNLRFELEYARGEGPPSIVGKFASSDPVSRQTGIALLNYLREVRFYQQLRSTLDVQTPEVLFTDVDEATHDFCLMMEDLAPAVQGDQIRGCGADEAALAITQLARLHGPRWGDPTLLQIDWIGKPQPDGEPNMVVGLWNSVFEGFMGRYADRLSRDEQRLTEALNERFEAYAARPRGALTVTHGDFRLDNMLFGGPYPLAIVDWQSPGVGRGTADVAYFMGTSLPTALRRSEERALLAEYHDRLLAYGVEGFSADDLWREYRLSSFAGLVMAVIASMIVEQTDRGDDMFMAMGTRSAAMAADLEAIDLLEAS